MKLELDKISVTYDEKVALQDVSFSVNAGESVAILGPNGCGKTTLLCAMDQLVEYEGSMHFDGQLLSDMKRREVARYMAWMAQFSNAYYLYTVKETVQLGRYIHEGQEDKSDYFLDFVGISDLKDRTLDTLSGGQLQRVLLARTLAQESPIVLLDEPFNHLDLKVQEEMLDILDRWRQQTTVVNGKEIPNTLISVFHDIPMASAIANRFIVMDQGRVVSDSKELDWQSLQKVYGIDVKEVYRKRLEEVE